jgi:cell division protein FtsB
MKRNKELERELQKRAERLKNLLEDYKAFQKQTEELQKMGLQKRAERLKNLLEDYKAFQKQIEELQKIGLQKRAERLKNLLEDYKAFQKQIEELEQKLGVNKTTTEKIAEILIRTTNPQRKEQLKKLLEFSQKLDEIERQLRKEYQDLIRKLQTKHAKALKLEAIPLKPEQEERIKTLKPYKLMSPTEQLLREEIYTSLLQPLQRGQRKIDFMIDTSKILNLEKTPQPPTINEIAKQFLNQAKTTQKTQTNQKTQTKKSQKSKTKKWGSYPWKNKLKTSNK